MTFCTTWRTEHFMTLYTTGQAICTMTLYKQGTIVSALYTGFRVWWILSITHTTHNTVFEFFHTYMWSHENFTSEFEWSDNSCLARRRRNFWTSTLKFIKIGPCPRNFRMNSTPHQVVRALWVSLDFFLIEFSITHTTHHTKFREIVCDHTHTQIFFGTLALHNATKQA